MSDEQLRVTADLSFTVDVPSRSARPTRCTGRVEADGGRDVTVSFSPVPSLGGSSTRPLVRPLAERLDDLGLTLHVHGPQGPLVRLGAGVDAPWWQWPATRSSRIELLDARALARSLRGPRVFEVALPPSAVLPEVTDRQRSRRRRVGVALRQLGRRVVRRRR
ncbi:hypothetical protein GCM10009616_24330 [Microlunatus lacustris]